MLPQPKCSSCCAALPADGARVGPSYSQTCSQPLPLFCGCSPAGLVFENAVYGKLKVSPQVTPSGWSSVLLQRVIIHRVQCRSRRFELLILATCNDHAPCAQVPVRCRCDLAALGSLAFATDCSITLSTLP